MVTCKDASLHAMIGRNHSLQLECKDASLHAMKGHNHLLQIECKDTSLHAMIGRKCAAHKILSRVSRLNYNLKSPLHITYIPGLNQPSTNQ